MRVLSAVATLGLVPVPYMSTLADCGRDRRPTESEVSAGQVACHPDPRTSGDATNEGRARSHCKLCEINAGLNTSVLGSEVGGSPVSTTMGSVAEGELAAPQPIAGLLGSC